MTISLPPEIAALLTAEVIWEKWLGFDGHAEPRYDAPVSLTCWIEPRPTISAGGANAIRRPENTSVDLQYTLYFSGDNADARGMSTFDRFTLPTPFSSDKPLQADYVNAWYGPPFDNLNPWLIEVSV